MGGINVVNLYSSKIFMASGINLKYGNLLVGIFNLIGSFIPMIVINKFGRKSLLIASFTCMFIS